MSPKVKLSDIADAIDNQSDDTTAYLNRKTGEITLMNNDHIAAIEHRDDPTEGVP